MREERVDAKFYGKIQNTEKDPNTLMEKTKFRLKSDEWDSRFQTNEFGFRGEAKSTKYLFLGDSFTISIRLDRENTFFGILQDKGYENAPLATGGWCTVDERKALKKYHEIYNPDKVFLIFYAQNDVWENYVTTITRFSCRHPYYGILAIISQLPLGRTLIKKVSSKIPIAKNIFVNQNLISLNSQFSVYEENYDYQMREAWDITKRELLRIKTFCESHDIELEVVSAPSPYQICEAWRDQKKLKGRFGNNYSRRNLKNLDYNKPERILRKICEMENINFYSLLENSNWECEDYFDSVDHWNQQGHQKVQKLLQKRLN